MYLLNIFILIFIGLWRGFGTWSISGCFFLASSVFFITQIILSNEIGALKKITSKFDLNQIPAPSDNLEYVYYDLIALDIVDFDGIIINNENNFFLNEAALIEVPDGTTFVCKCFL